ncbi:MAG: OmpA family protein [Rhodospirillales bacterium]
MARNNRFTNPQQSDNDEDWLTTYADAITLLMAFFVLTTSISKVDLEAFEQINEGIKKQINAKSNETTPTREFREEIKGVAENNNVSEQVSVSADSDSINLDLAGRSFFKPGSAEMTAEAAPFLDDIAGMLAEERYQRFRIDVQGHTDDDPISTPQFPSNWELSAARASAVVRYIASKGVAPERMRATGFADTIPKVPNRDPQGNPIRVNQEENRRITIRVFPR